MSFNFRHKNHNFKFDFKFDFMGNITRVYTCNTCSTVCIYNDYTNTYFLCNVYNAKLQDLTCQEVLIKDILE